MNAVPAADANGDYVYSQSMQSFVQLHHDESNLKHYTIEWHSLYQGVRQQWCMVEHAEQISAGATGNGNFPANSKVLYCQRSGSSSAEALPCAKEIWVKLAPVGNGSYNTIDQETRLVVTVSCII